MILVSLAMAYWGVKAEVGGDKKLLKVQSVA